MFETLQEKTEEKAMVQFLERFTDYPFLVKFKNSEYHIGEGEPTFTVNFKKSIPLADLMNSTSLALGEGIWISREIFMKRWIIFWVRWENFLPMNLL